jgi:DNA mismatch repair protein MLH1
LVRILYGPSVAKELIEFRLTDDQYQFKVEGHVTNVNYSVKKLVFLLFINHRLVESSALKKCIENVYASYLPKAGFFFGTFTAVCPLVFA